jgi:hypothetical protein
VQRRLCRQAVERQRHEPRHARARLGNHADAAAYSECGGNEQRYKDKPTSMPCQRVSR